MKFAVVSLKNTKRVIEVLDMFGYDIVRAKPDYVITYEGDETILYAERVFPGVPKITLRGSDGGFKCKFSEFDLEDVLLKIESGEHKIQEELKLETEFKGKKYLSLNQVQVHNSSPIRTIALSVYVDDAIMFGKVVGDGVVVATPFGSTDYYHSVGGKEFDCGIGIAINNQYGIKDDSVVIHDGSKICINILREDGLLVFDNDDNTIKVKSGDEIIIRAAKDTAKFVTI